MANKMIKIILIALLALTAVGLAACSKDHVTLDGDGMVYSWYDYEFKHEWTAYTACDGEPAILTIDDTTITYKNLYGKSGTWQYTLPEGTDRYGKPEEPVYLRIDDETCPFEDLVFHEEEIEEEGNSTLVPILSGTIYMADRRIGIVDIEFTITEMSHHIPDGYRSYLAREIDSTPAFGDLDPFLESDMETTDDGNALASNTDDLLIMMTDGDGMVHDIAEDVDHCTFDIVPLDSGKKKAVLKGINNRGEELFTYETEPTKGNITPIGDVYNAYALVCDGRVIEVCTVGIFMGDEDWVNDDFGGDVGACTVDTTDTLNNTLYICGKTGPALIVIDAIGRTIARYDTLDYGSYGNAASFKNPTDVTFIDGATIMITYEGNKTVTIDPRTGKAR